MKHTLKEKFLIRFHKFMKMICWHWHGPFGDGFHYHYHKLKKLEPDKWS